MNTYRKGFSSRRIFKLLILTGFCGFLAWVLILFEMDIRTLNVMTPITFLFVLPIVLSIYLLSRGMGR